MNLKKIKDSFLKIKDNFEEWSTVDLQKQARVSDPDLSEMDALNLSREEAIAIITSTY